MIRVGSLTDMAALEPHRRDTKSGLTAGEQLSRIYAAVEPLYARRDAAFRDVDARLAQEDLCRTSMDELDSSERKYIKRYFNTMIAPVLSPQVVDSHHPFPHLEGKVLHIAVLLSHKKNERLGLIPVPASLPPITFLPNDKRRYLMTEDILLAFADSIFEMYDVLEKTVFCVTRTQMCRSMMSRSARSRSICARKWSACCASAAAWRSSASSSAARLSSHFKECLHKRFEVTDEQIFLSRSAPLRMSYAFSLGDYLSDGRRSRLSDPPFIPQQPAMLPAGRSLLKTALQRDVLLSYPYESMEPFLQMIREAANDPPVLSVRITIYRLASKAKLVEYLCAAAENGKDVTVLIELRARFDEQNNSTGPNASKKPDARSSTASRNIRCIPRSASSRAGSAAACAISRRSAPATTTRKPPSSTRTCRSSRRMNASVRTQARSSTTWRSATCPDATAAYSSRRPA